MMVKNFTITLASTRLVKQCVLQGSYTEFPAALLPAAFSQHLEQTLSEYRSVEETS